MVGYRDLYVTLTWILSDPISSTSEGRVYVDAETPRTVCGWQTTRWGEIRRVYGDNYDRRKVIIDVRMISKRISVTIHHLEADDARYNYVLTVVDKHQHTVTNRQAWIVLYGKCVLTWSAVTFILRWWASFGG